MGDLPAIDVIRLGLSTGVLLILLSIPFTPMRHIPARPLTKISGAIFLITAAIARAVALLHITNAWWLANDIIHVLALIVFMITFCEMVAESAEQRRKFLAAQQDCVDAKTETD